jgi:sugar phosphate isomerase/epimerase
VVPKQVSTEPARLLSRRDVLGAAAGWPLLATVASAADSGMPRAAQSGATGSATAPRLPIGLVSRHVQWTSLEAAVDLAAEAGFDAIEWNVRSGGHVVPERVADDLPRAVERTRKAGLDVTMITTSIQDSQSPHAESILRTMQALGIRYFRGGEYFRYDYTVPQATQLEALRVRIAPLLTLNERYGTTWAYHTHSAPGMIGGNVWDIVSVLRGMDPARMALNYDTGHTTVRGGTGWIDDARLAEPYVACLAVKDVRWQQGPRGWRAEFVPIGEGQVDFAAIARFLKASRFSGPVNIHYEHNGLLGSDVGKWMLDMPRDRFLAIVRQDLARVRAALA